jgi:hypothetical protein
MMLQSKPTEKNSTTHLKDKKVDQQDTYFFTVFRCFSVFIQFLILPLDSDSAGYSSSFLGLVKALLLNRKRGQHHHLSES